MFFGIFRGENFLGEAPQTPLCEEMPFGHFILWNSALEVRNKPRKAAASRMDVPAAELLAVHARGDP